MTDKAILIIDDNPTHLKLEEIALAGNNYNIRTAANVDEALEILKTFLPQLILMDVQLPGVDGLDLTRRIKANPKFHNVDIIAITAYGMIGDKEKILEAGCDNYISKPIDIKAFQKMIADYFDKKLCNQEK